jgi:hypothetical protein
VSVAFGYMILGIASVLTGDGDYSAWGDAAHPPVVGLGCGYVSWPRARWRHHERLIMNTRS